LGVNLPKGGLSMRSKGKVEIGEAATELLVDGTGDRVVLLPGGGLDASYFEDLAQRLAHEGFVLSR